MPECNLSVSADLCLTLTATMMFHNQASAMPPGAAVGLDWEEVFCLWWPVGALTGKCKFTSTVKHLNRTIATEGHDMGPLLTHRAVVPLPTDVLWILAMIKSSRKMNFAAGMVQGNGEPLACGNMFPYLMNACGSPASLPVAAPVGNATNSATVNMHTVDVIAGFTQIAAGIVVDVLTASRAARITKKEIVELVVGSAFDWKKFLTNTLANNQGGLIRLMGRSFCPDYQGPATFGISYDRGLSGGVSGQVTISNDGTSVQVGVSSQGGLASASVQHTRPTTGQATTTASSRSGSTSTSTTRTHGSPRGDHL